MTSSPVDGGRLSYEIDRRKKEYSLADFTQKGMELLENPQGFFMMVKGGKIDWVCHANDARTAISEVLSFNDAVQKAIDFAKKHPQETLIMVTGDHETGGFSLGSAVSKYESSLYLLKNQKVSFVKFDEIFTKWIEENKKTSFEDFLNLSKEYFGLGLDVEDLKLSYFDKEQLKSF